MKRIELLKHKRSFRTNIENEEVIRKLSKYKFSLILDADEFRFVPNSLQLWSKLWTEGAKSQYNRFVSSCKNCTNNCSKTLEFNIEETSGYFYRWDRTFVIPSYGVRILVNNSLVGVYCPKFNILLASDWLYSEFSLDMALQLLDKLANLGIVQTSQKTLVTFKHHSVTIGSDPEFELLTSYSIYDPIRQHIYDVDGVDYPPYGNVGCDGAGDQIEIRPNASASIKRHLFNLMMLIKIVDEPLAVIGDRFPLGCHIHFGIPQSAKEFIHQLVKALDDFLGIHLIELSGEARKQYKRLSAYRVKRHGFEYRTLPSAILAKPSIAKVVFKIAKNVVTTLLKNGIIEYNDEPTIEDYKRIAKINDSEYNTLFRFIDKYPRIVAKYPAINDLWIK